MSEPTSHDHTTVNIVIFGYHWVGVHSIVDRQIGYAQGSDYERVFDPFDTGEQYQGPIIVNGEPVVINWITLAIHFDDTSGDSIPIEAQVQYVRELVRQSDACVLVYSCTSRYGFEHLTLLQPSSPDVPLCKHMWVLANKSDCRRADWEVSLLEGDDFSSRIGATFRQVSARTGYGTEGFGHEVAACVLAGREREAIGSTGAR